MYSLLQLVLGIGHILGARIFFLRLVGNADAACQIQTELDSAILGSYSVLIGDQLTLLKSIIAEKSEDTEHNEQSQEAEQSLSFVALHDKISFLI